MPKARIPMKKIVEILRLKHEAKLSHEKIARVCQLSKGAVSKYVSLARARGVGWPLPEGVDEVALEALLFPAREKPSRFVQPDGFQIHQELKRKEVTLQLLWSEYVARHGERAYRYSRYCELYRQWRAQQKRSMRQQHRAGEKLFIDYCGPTVEIIDRLSGEVRAAQIFVGVLGASSYTYAEATWSQSLPDWIGSHRRMLRFFGGAPSLLVPDNLKAAVTRASRYAPEVNATYAEMASHYGCLVLPARPYKPKDKAKAEVAVQVVERWILARLRHRTFFSLAELNTAIAELLPALNERPFQGRSESRRDLYESLDRPALKPLPEDDYEFAEWRRVKPGIDYHVEVDKRFYSVPHALVGQTLDLRITATTVEVLHKGKRVAAHTRHGPGRFSTQTAHMPKSHQAHRDWSPGRFLKWAAEMGPATTQVVRRQLEDRPHPEHGYRACLGLLNLGRRYSRDRLEAACQRAIAIGATRYQSVASILRQGLDRLPPEEKAAHGSLPPHGNVRGAGYYH